MKKKKKRTLEILIHKNKMNLCGVKLKEYIDLPNPIVQHAFDLSYYINVWNEFFSSIDIPDDMKSIYYAVNMIYGNFFTDYSIIPTIFLLTNDKIYKLQYKDKKTLQYTDIILFSNPMIRNHSYQPVWVEQYVYEMKPYLEYFIQHTNKYIGASFDKERGLISPNTSFIHKLMDGFNILSHAQQPVHILNWDEIMKGMTHGLMNNTDNVVGKIKEYTEKYIKPLLVHLPNELILDVYFIGYAKNPGNMEWGSRSDPQGRLYIIGKNMIYEVFLESYANDSIYPFSIGQFMNAFHSTLPYYRIIIKPTIPYSTSKRLLQFCQSTRNYAMISSSNNGEQAYKMIQDTFLALIPLEDPFEKLTESEINQIIDRNVSWKEDEYTHVMDDVIKATKPIKAPMSVDWLNRLESVSTRLIHHYQTQPFIDRINNIKKRNSLTMEEFTDFGKEMIQYVEQQHNEWRTSFLHENSKWKRHYIYPDQNEPDQNEPDQKEQNEQNEPEQDDRLIRLQKEYEQKEYELQECRKELMKKNKLIEKLLMHSRNK